MIFLKFTVNPLTLISFGRSSPFESTPVALQCLKLGGSGRPTHLAPRGALALKPYLRTLNAELATLEGITPKLQVINQAEMDQVRLGKRMCLGESPDLGGRVRKRRSCSCCWLVFFCWGWWWLGVWEWVGYTSFISGWLGQTFSCWWLVTSCCL